MKTSIVVTMFHKKKYLEALEYIHKNRDVADLILSSKDKTKVRYYEALCYANLKKYGMALTVLDQCISSGLSIEYIYQARMLRGYIFTVNKRLGMAEAEFTQLLKDGYESARVFAAIAHVVYQLNKVAKAVRYLQKALEIDSENINALNSMAYILSENNVKLPLALRYIEKVLKKHPRNPAYLDTYGVVLIKLKRFTDARRILGVALTLTDHRDIKKHYDIAVKDVDWGDKKVRK